jgi:hypothetical protein
MLLSRMKKVFQSSDKLARAEVFETGKRSIGWDQIQILHVGRHSRLANSNLAAKKISTQAIGTR